METEPDANDAPLVPRDRKASLIAGGVCHRLELVQNSLQHRDAERQLNLSSGTVQSPSNHVQLVVTPSRWPGTSCADAMNFQTMTAHAKSVIGRHAFQHGRYLLIAEFD